MLDCLDREEFGCTGGVVRVRGRVWVRVRVLVRVLVRGRVREWFL